MRTYKVIRGPYCDYPRVHYDADTTMAVTEPSYYSRNNFYILFPVKGIVSSGKSFLVASTFV